MSFPLLATKFTIPTSGTKFISRTRLTQLLDQSLEQSARLVLVCAPAGYGKTSIVSNWLQTSQRLHANQFTWLALEQGDNDLTRFLTYFITAFQRVLPGFGSSVLKMIQTHKPLPAPALATLLINELSEIPQWIFLILDDYHLISAKAIQDFISFWVDHQPPRMRLVLITRTDPPLPLARLRARGQLVELRQDGLCFLPEEVTEFFNQAMGLGVTPDQIAFLVTQTEGWISGLQLAAISLRDRQDRTSFFNTFSGEHEFIADYLTEEVLSHLSNEVRLFLLQTSILGRLSAPLCEAVIGQTGAQAILEQLLENNLFIFALDSQHAWFRYHTLFADLCRKRLLAACGDQVAELHERASGWFEKNGQIDQAIEHAIAGRSFNRASRLIEQIAESLLMVGQAPTLLNWLEALSEEELSTRRFLSILLGLAQILCSRPIKTVVSQVEKISQSWSQAEPQGDIHMLQAWLAVLQGDAARAVQFSELALQQLPAEHIFFRSLAAETLGMGNTLKGNIPAATQAFELVVKLSQQTDNVMMTIMALTNLAGLQYFHGRLLAAMGTCRQIIELSAARIGDRLPMMARPLLNLGEIYREQGDLESASHYLNQASQLMEDFSDIGLSVAYLSLARLMLNQKDWIAARRYIEQARQLALASQASQMTEELVENVEALLWIKQGEVNQAVHWARRRGILDRPPAELFAGIGEKAALNEFFVSKMIILIRLYISLGQPDPAIALIDRLTETNARYDYHRREVEFLVLKALALLLMKDVPMATETLTGALLAGETDGYFMTFVDEGEPMARLLYTAIQKNISPHYASRLLNAITARAPKVAANEPPVDELVEPLSQRELEVLRSIATGASNAEIALHLCISLSTVKGHTTQIFGKLGVKNRTQAVARAQVLGLLPPHQEQSESHLPESIP